MMYCNSYGLDQTLLAISSLVNNVDSGYLLTMLMASIVLAALAVAMYFYGQSQKMEKKNKALQTYIDSNVKLEQFAHMASHDFKSPLRTIQSFSGLLKKKLGDEADADTKQYLNFIIDSVQHLEKSTEGLLDLSAVNSLTLKRSTFNLREMFDEINKSLEYEIKKKNAKIILQNLPIDINADRQKIKTLFQNLLSNSLKFSKPKVQPEIKIACKQLGNNFIFSVTDNGIGIERKYQTEVFESFKKLHPGQYGHSSGMGLSIAKSIVENHGGEMRLISHKGKGSRFVFTIQRNGLKICDHPKKELLSL